MHLLEVKHLRVDYESLIAVNDVSFSLKPGDICGLVGPNGAGKSSMIKAIAGLIEPTIGEIKINQALVSEQRGVALLSLGYMPEKPPLYEDLTVKEFLMLFASAYQIIPAQREQRVTEVIRLVQLNEKIHTLAGELSKGMKQRLFLAKTLIHDPKVLVLDEPADGLDPISREELSNLLKSLAKEGKAILVSSHILQELDSFCNHVCILERGKLLTFGSIDDVRDGIKTQSNYQTHIRINSNCTKEILQRHLLEVLSLSFTLNQINHQSFDLTIESQFTEDKQIELLKAISQRDEIRLKGFYVIEADLQSILRSVSSGKTQ
jgi:ABC-2 type transport system ATP-binding protein